jgi:hypothetical protein
VSVCYESSRLNTDENDEPDVEVGLPPHYTRYAAEHGGESYRTGGIARVERGGLNQGEDGGEDLGDTVSPRYEYGGLNLG